MKEGGKVHRESVHYVTLVFCCCVRRGQLLLCSPGSAVAVFAGGSWGFSTSLVNVVLFTGMVN